MVRPQGLTIMFKKALTLYNNIKDKVIVLYQKLNLKKHEKTKGRKLSISIVDSLTLALYKQNRKIQTKKSLFEMTGLACSYKTFVESLNRVARFLARFISVLLTINRQSSNIVKHTDSTDIPVCLNKNASRHKTMSMFSSWSKTGKGWFYGLKLHLTSDLNGKILAIRFTSGNSNDRKVCREMNDKLRGLFVADAGYISSELEKDFFIENERAIFIMPRANMKKLASALDIFLLNTRMKVEVNFRNLKLFFGLLTSLPRSIDGYLANYLSSILAYMIA
jgi:hypothetical protein